MRFVDPTPEHVDTWKKWVAERPPAVRAVAERFDPWTLYAMPGGFRVTIYSFGERLDGSGVTLTVSVLGEFNKITFERNVFGIDPDDLVECDLPLSDEVLGASLVTREEVDAFIASERARMGIADEDECKCALCGSSEYQADAPVIVTYDEAAQPTEDDYERIRAITDDILSKRSGGES